MPVFPNPTAHLSIANVVDNVPGWPKNQIRYYGYDKAVSCELARIAFMSLTRLQMLGATTTTVPPPPTGTGWQRRTCADVAGGDVITERTDDAAAVVIPADGSAWATGNPNDADDDGTAITFSEPVILNP